MAKKKNKPQVINNIQELNLEIDYDKLAEAIVKANNTEKEYNNSKEKLNFLKVIYYIVFNQKQTNGKMISGLLSGLIALIFNIMAILGMGVFVCGIIAMINIIKSCIWSLNAIPYNIAAIIAMIAFVLVIAMFSLLFRAAANEMEKEEDRDYIIAVFSGIVSFAALVVALVAILKGVG